MRTQVPNLELAEYRVMEQLTKNEVFQERLKSKREEYKFIHPDLVFLMFPQMWASTCTGFDVCEDGSAAFGGDAMTEEYTLIAHERTTDMYVVCFGTRPCYLVDAPNEDFLADIEKHSMASLSEAKQRY